MKVIVIGGGKVGYYLTRTLIEHNHTPVLVEVNKSLCHYLANDLDIPVIWETERRSKRLKEPASLTWKRL